MRTRSSEELMVLYQQDVPGAFDELYRRHQGKVEALCIRLVTRFHKELLPHIADIVQDVFAHLHRHKERFIRGGCFGNFLFTLTKRVTLNYMQYEFGRDAITAVGRPQSPDQAIAPDPLIEIHETEANEWEVAHGLHALSADHRQAILLVYFNGLTSQQAADRLGVPVSTFNRWRRSALAEMKRALQDAEAALA